MPHRFAPSAHAGAGPTPRGLPRGFSYLWVLLSVAFLGVSLVLAAEVHTTATRRSQEAELLAIGHQFREALRRFHERQVNGGKQYPSTLDELLQDPRGAGLTRHLRQVFVDPMTGKPEWGLVRVAGRIVGVHSLSEGQPLKQAGFDDEDIGFQQAKRYRDWVFVHPPGLLLNPPEAQQALVNPVPGGLSAAPPTPTLTPAQR